MTDENDNNRPAGSGAPGSRAPLTLKPRTGGAVSSGMVKQSFSHGRSKTVVVETKRRRVDAPAASVPERRPPVETRPPAPAPRPAPAASGGPAPQAGPQRQLSDDERRARQRVIEEATRASQERVATEQAERSRAEAQAAAQRAEAARAAAAAAEAQRAAQQQAAAEAAPVAAPAPSAEPAEPAPAAAAPAPQPQPADAPATVARAPEPQRPAAPSARPAEAPARPAYNQSRPDQARTPPNHGQGQRHEGQRHEGQRQGPPPQRSGEASRPTAPGQTRTYEPSRDRRDDRPTTTTYRPAPTQGVAFNQRVARPDQARPPRDDTRGPRDDTRGPRDDARGPRNDRPDGRSDAQRPQTVRYSAIAPARPPREGGPRTGGPRPGGPRPPPSSAPSGPEVQRAARQAPRPGAATLDRRPDFDDESGSAARGRTAARGTAVSRTKGEPKRREGRLTIQAVAGDDEGAVERMRSLASVRRAREREREKRKGGATEQARSAREVVIPDIITVQELANRMAVRGVEVIKFLVRSGLMLKINDVIDSDMAELVAAEFGLTVRRVSESDVETGFLTEDDHEEGTVPRPPVVTVMGHVDHGKTSLLDALRSTDVAAGEAGGITQHIGAYQVQLPSGDRVTFLDTPGHAAFSAMRARGANLTDIVVLVVAADDGVMPQTVEAISHAKAAGTPIIVAINKIDKPDANPTRVINELLQHEIVAESLGGETQMIEVSALEKLGLDDLLEAILLQAEVMDLRANPDRTAEGVVIESQIDRGRGAVATVLVKRGTLKRGDIVVAGAASGRVRALLNEREEQVPTAGPSTPVVILGLDGAADPGEPFAVVENDARARELTDYRIRLKRERSLTPVGAAPTLADMMAKLADKKVSELPILIKADTQGSAEAIVGSLDKLGTDEVRARFILSGAGAINESDVMLAKGANAPIIGFNVRASKQARALAEHEGVEIRYYAIIYDLIDDIKGVLSGMLAPIQRESFLGFAEVLQVFDITKVGKVAGCRVREGVVRRGARVRIIRNDIVVLELGTLRTLKRFKDEVAEVANGFECGMEFAGFQDIQVGDHIECFTVEEVKRSL
ncbi:MAG TPA: translation initiation factor IF-2 [Caulobacteraceae bacterium]|nr:translation initiation factor IF-2 [Caulobacteraceae bacterium]